jgi:hypothetical protein
VARRKISELDPFVEPLYNELPMPRRPGKLGVQSAGGRSKHRPMPRNMINR